MKAVESIPTLSDVDLHLYLAGAMPLGKRLLLRWNLFLDAGLRARLAELRRGNAEFAALEMPALRGRLFPGAPGQAGSAALPAPAPSRPHGAAAGGVDWSSLLGGRRFGYALAGGFAVLALCAVPFLGRLPTSAVDGVDGLDGLDGVAAEGSDLIPKGRGLGVILYVKGDSTYRVENHAARMAPTDTLQAVPLGSAPQHLVLFGWDARQGLVRIFPAEGSTSRMASAAEPPPALLLQGMEENRLVCVTSGSPFQVEAALALLGRKPFQPLLKAPAVHLEQGLYVQVFTLVKTRGGRI